MIFSSNFFPCINYFSTILRHSEVKINISEQYRKQSYRNRAYILGPHQLETLTIPILKSANNSLISEIKIDNTDNWQRKNWKTIENCYRNSPYFQYLDYLFLPIFQKKYENLIDINTESLSVCLKMLKINKPICLDEFSYFENINQFISFNAKERDENLENIKIEKYNQLFGNKFEENLSILDLLFCKGPNDGLQILKNKNLSPARYKGEGV